MRKSCEAALQPPACTRSPLLQEGRAPAFKAVGCCARSAASRRRCCKAGAAAATTGDATQRRFAASRSAATCCKGRTHPVLQRGEGFSVAPSKLLGRPGVPDRCTDSAKDGLPADATKPVAGGSAGATRPTVECCDAARLQQYQCCKVVGAAMEHRRGARCCDGEYR